MHPHLWGKKHCKAAGKTCDKCGKKDHLSKVCRSSTKTDVDTSNSHSTNDTVEFAADKSVESNWACGASQGEVTEFFSSYDPNDIEFYANNKSDESYLPSFDPSSHKPCFAKIKRKMDRKNLSTLSNMKNKVVYTDLYEKWFGLALVLVTGSAILSSMPSGEGQLSSAQAVNVSQGSLVLGHHVFSHGKGWLKQAARKKPMIELYSKLDMSAYKALGVKPLSKQCKVSWGRHLADTGASICP